MNNAEIIQRLAQKDEEVLLTLRDRYGAYCHQIAMRLLEDVSSAEECVNDVWLAVWRSDTIPQNLKPYLAKITRNCALRRIEYEGAKKRSGITLLLSELSDAIPTPAQNDTIDLREALNTFLRGLDGQERRLFLQRYWYGCPIAELAQERHQSESRVTSTLFRLRKRLKKFLEKEGWQL